MDSIHIYTNGTGHKAAWLIVAATGTTAHYTRPGTCPVDNGSGGTVRTVLRGQMVAMYHCLFDLSMTERYVPITIYTPSDIALTTRLNAGDFNVNVDMRKLPEFLIRIYGLTVAYDVRPVTHPYMARVSGMLDAKPEGAFL